jgi:hypothetical protein
MPYSLSVPAGTIRTFHALRAFGALHALRTLRPLDALGTLGPFGALGALGPVGAAAAPAPVVGLEPRHAIGALGRLGSLGRHRALRGLSAPCGYRGGRGDGGLRAPVVLARAARLVLHDAAVVTKLDSDARAVRVDAADAQPVESCLGGELTRQIGPLGGG